MNRQPKTIWTLLSIMGLCALCAYLVPMITVTAGEPEPAAEKPAKVDDPSPDDAAAAEPAEESHSVGQKAVDAPPAEPNLDAVVELADGDPQALANPPAQADEGPQVDGASAGGTEIPTGGGASASPAPEQQGHPAGDPESERGGDAGGPRAPFDPATLKLSFQAYLTDNAGDALPGPLVDLEFNIYTGGGGLVEGPIAMAGVDINDGVVDVLVPVSASSFDGSERLMGVTVNPPAVELTPRTPLVSVPYALRVDRVASGELDDNISLGDAVTNGSLTIFSSSYGSPGINMTGQFGQISTFGSDGLEQTRLWNGAWGELLLWDGSVTNDQTVVLSATSDSGGQLRLHDATGGNSVFLEGGTGTVNAEGSLNVVDSIGGTTLGRIYNFGSGSWVESFDPAGDRTGIMGTGSGGDGGFMHLYNSSNIITVRIDGDDGDAGLIEVSDIAGANRVRIDGQSTGTGGEISVFDDDGTETIEILGAETASQGAQILLRKADGTTTIEIDGDFNGDGRIITQELQITGGSDLSEQFDVSEALGTGPAPGMVVSIDLNRPGKLIVSAKAYDRTVAGIISGAGGVDTGLYMGQKGTPADGSYPVALTGRVYCWCDATRGAIQPGDLLTTSATPGYAMKVRDHARAQGAILGKAMTSLDEGRGLVLVLVTLQ